MYIQSNYDSVNMYGAKDSPNFWKRAKQKVLDALPDITVKADTRSIDTWKRCNDRITHPGNNRAIMGATALILQPTIDAHNHKVDKETREVSRIRTISKIVVGTLVGIAVRGSCYKIVDKMTNIKGKSSISKKLLPTDTKLLNDLLKYNDLLANHKNAISTGLAILAMCVTNFAIDAPLTTYLTNFLNDKRKERKEERRLNNG
jgi:hypothetical protein